MTLKTTRWDVTEHLDSGESIAAFIDDILEDGDPKLVAAALGDVARARGMTQIAQEAGVSREALYRALSRDGNPELTTIMKVMKALRLRLAAAPAA